MKKLLVIACLLLALLLAVTACTQDPPAEQPTDTHETGTGTPTEPEETQPEDSKPEETQPEETKPQETKPEETKPQETEPQETKPQETEPQETEPQETEPQETEPEIIENTDIYFFTEVENEDVGTAIDYTDMFNLFDMSLPQGSCGVEMFNGQKVYAMRLINGLYYTNDGFYYFKTNNVQTTLAADGKLKSYMLIRAYQRVNSDWLIQNEDTGAAQVISIKQFYENDGAGHTGGAGIYAAIMDGNLHLILKYYDDTANRRIGNKLYTVPCEGTELTMADDGSTVYVLVGDKLLATIALSGSITYEDIKAENCSPGNTFAASATIKLADGTEETIENTLIADTPLSQIGISNRGNAQAGSFLFSYLEYGPFSEISIPEMDVTTPPETEPQETEPQETEPQETEPEPEPIVIPDTTGSFTSNVNGYENGTTFDQTDLPNFFEMKLAQGNCVIEELNGQKVYGMHLINAMVHTNDGLYYFKLDNAQTALAADGKLKSYMIVRGYQQVISDASLSSNTRILSFYENDGAGHTGGAGIYAAVMDGNLHIILKYYNVSAERRIGNKLYTIPCEGTALTMADDGSTVYILVGDKLMATVALSGSITYADIKAENCSPRNTFAASATIKLANGNEETIENTLIADTPLSQIGISNRGNSAAGTFLFSSVEYGPFSAITIPEFAFCNHNWVDATCTESKYCSLCQIVEGAPLGHSFAEGTCTACGEKDQLYGIANTTVSFTADVNKYDAGTTFDQTDLPGFFEMKLAQGGCMIEELNGQKVYGMHMINAMAHTNDGLYYFKLNNAQTTLAADGKLKSYMIVRGYQQVISDETASSNTRIRQFYEGDGAGHTGGAGIYAAIMDGNLHLIVKYYDSTVSRRVGNKYYTILCTGTELTLADDGYCVYVLVDGKLMATVELSGSKTYGDIKAANCIPGNTFAETAKITLADGTQEIVENTLIADTPLSQIGISNRGNATAAVFQFSSLEYGAFSDITIPEMKTDK
ncbi:MAG: hypothetical protein IJD38_11990 [Clostridia bacterium]|nr:hypothetical protein [Clostridia bacterium]